MLNSFVFLFVYFSFLLQYNCAFLSFCYQFILTKSLDFPMLALSVDFCVVVGSTRTLTRINPLKQAGYGAMVAAHGAVSAAEMRRRQ